MNTKEFNELAIKLVKDTFHEGAEIQLETVWQAHILGNKKAIICDLNPKNHFLFEITYNANKNEMYIDRYEETYNIDYFVSADNKSAERIKSTVVRL